MIRNLSSKLLVGLGLSLLAACAQLEVAERAVSYNKAVETAGNKMLLLNAVRSAKRYPMYFSGVSIVRGAVPVSGSIQFGIPIGGDADAVWSIAPNLDLSSGTSFELPTLDSKEFLNAMSTEISAETLKFFVDNRWADAVLMNMFVNVLEMPTSIHDQVNSKVETICRSLLDAGNTIQSRIDDLSPPQLDYDKLDDFELLSVRDEKRELEENESDRKLCQIIRENVRQCGIETKVTDGNISYLNYGRNECGLKRFQGFMRKLRLLDLEFSSKTDKNTKATTKITTTKSTLKDGDDQEKEKETTTETEVEVSKKTTVFAKLLELEEVETKIDSGQDDDGMGASTDEESEAKEPGDADTSETTQKADKKELRIHLRSPLGMLSYLGDLIAGQQLVRTKFEPQIVVGSDRTLVPFFEVQRGTGVVDSASVSVDHEGDVFFIPRTDPEQWPEPRSMQVLSLVSQVINQQISLEDLPTASSVNVVGGS